MASSSVLNILEPRDLPLWGQPPPAPRTRESNNPTLLFSWWCTIFAAVIIIVRLCGRKTRSNVLFQEDWIMMLALIPLLIRMAFIHVVLLYGTNNVQTEGVEYTEIQLHQRAIGARLVLAARIFYAMFIWISKLTVSEFLKRITIRIWRRSYELTLQGIRVFLFITFFAVVTATLAECQPFDHYWQVKPDPGPHCRQGYGNLITMGTCDIVTDILLIAFPIPIIMQAGQTWKRKVQLGALFSLSLILIIVTAIRIPKIVSYHGRQQYRTVWASAEILASAAVSNSVVIGSFLRDKGTKRNKYKSGSVSDSVDRASIRRATLATLENKNSDEDLFRYLGMRVPEHLRDQKDSTPRPAPLASPTLNRRSQDRRSSLEISEVKDAGENHSSDSDDSMRKQAAVQPHRSSSPNSSSNHAASFFDVGGLLENGKQSQSPESHSQTNAYRYSAQSAAGTVYTQDFASSPSQSRRGSRNATMLQDIGGLLTPSSSRASSGMDRYHTRRQSDSHMYPPSRHARPAPSGILSPTLERSETLQSLQDAGGLLSRIPESKTANTLWPIASHGSGRPALQQAKVRPHGSAVADQDDDLELEDLGGLLAGSHRPDASAAALQRRIHRQSAPQAIPSIACAQRSDGWESMDIQDPGGLLKR